MYQMIHLTATKWDSFSLALYLAQTPTLKAMLKWLAIRYNKLPIMLLYRLGSTSLPWSSLQIFKDVTMKVLTTLVFFQTNFFTLPIKWRSPYQLAWPASPRNILVHQTCLFKPVLHKINKLPRFCFRSGSKHNINYINLCYCQSRFEMFDKQSFISSPSFVSLLK